MLALILIVPIGIFIVGLDAREEKAIRIENPKKADTLSNTIAIRIVYDSEQTYFGNVGGNIEDVNLSKYVTPCRAEADLFTGWHMHCQRTLDEIEVARQLDVLKPWKNVHANFINSCLSLPNIGNINLRSATSAGLRDISASETEPHLGPMGRDKFNPHSSNCVFDLCALPQQRDELEDSPHHQESSEH